MSRFLIAFGFGKLAERVKVYSVQWLNRHIKELSAENVKGKPGETSTEKVGLIVVDEAHHAIADSYQNIFERNPLAMKMGMTATPCRMKRQSFGKLFGALLTSPPTKTFIEQGYLAPYDYVVVGSDMMVTVKRAGNYNTMTETEKKKYLKNVKPFFIKLDLGFEEWGLRVSTEDVILKPMYLFISPFVGDYAAFKSMQDYWGVLTRTGKVVVAPKYNKLELLPRGRVRITDLIGNDEVRYLKELLNI